jgi:hypothetical protein
MIVQPSDFVGKWAITQKYNSQDVQQLIDAYEEDVIYELLGVDLGNDLLNNIGSLPPELQFIFDPFAVNIEGRCGETLLVKSEGIRAMLLYILTGIYYLTDFGTATSEGKVKFKPEGGDLIDDSYNNNYILYNRGIKSYKAIQTYIEENEDDYPDYKGVKKPTAWLI